MPDATDRPADAAQLSSIASQLDELTARVTGIADSYASTPSSEISEDLYSAERGLVSARRAIGRALDALR